MKTNKDIYSQITEKIVKELESGIIPWQKPWQNSTCAGCVSHTSGKPYSILNQILLGMRAGEWLTYKQIQKEGGRIKNGEKSSIVVFWDFVNVKKVETETDEDGNEIEVEKIISRYPILKSYNVFHIDQCEGISPKFGNKPIENENEPIESAEKIARDYIQREQLDVRIKNTDRAFYRPSDDHVEVPEMKQYEITEEYYSTLFHELTHSTGHAKRLNRKEVVGVSFFGDSDYSKEELVAELGAAFACRLAGLDCERAFNNSVGYIQGWLRALKNDKRMIVAAATKAEQAVEYMLNGK